MTFEDPTLSNVPLEVPETVLVGPEADPQPLIDLGWVEIGTEGDNRVFKRP